MANLAGANGQEAWKAKLGEEEDGVLKCFYLITLARILNETLGAAAGGLRDVATLTRKQLAYCHACCHADPLRYSTTMRIAMRVAVRHSAKCLIATRQASQ